EPAAFARRDWPRLRSLSLRGNHLSAATVAALARPGLFPALRRLDVVWNQLYSDGLRALLECPWAAGLERLSVDIRTAGEGVELLATSPSLANLRHLQIEGDRAISGPTMNTLLNSRTLARLQTLDVQAPTTAALDELRLEQALPSLTALSLNLQSVT